MKKIIVLKPMKHNKSADVLLFLLSFTKCHRKENIEKTFFVSAGDQKRLEKGLEFWDCFTAISTESKK